MENTNINKFMYEVSVGRINLVPANKNTTEYEEVPTDTNKLFNNIDDALTWVTDDIIEECVNKVWVEGKCIDYLLVLCEVIPTENGNNFAPNKSMFDANLVYFRYDPMHILNPFKFRVSPDYKEDLRIKSVIDKINNLNIKILDTDNNFFSSNASEEALCKAGLNFLHKRM